MLTSAVFCFALRHSTSLGTYALCLNKLLPVKAGALALGSPLTRALVGELFSWPQPEAGQHLCLLDGIHARVFIKEESCAVKPDACLPQHLLQRQRAIRCSAPSDVEACASRTHARPHRMLTVLLHSRLQR